MVHITTAHDMSENTTPTVHRNTLGSKCRTNVLLAHNRERSARTTGDVAKGMLSFAKQFNTDFLLELQVKLEYCTVNSHIGISY